VVFACFLGIPISPVVLAAETPFVIVTVHFFNYQHDYEHKHDERETK